MTQTEPRTESLGRSPSRGERSRPVALVLLYVLVCLIWGTNWVAIKLAVTDMPAMLASGLRFLVAAPVLIVICLVKGVPMRFPKGLTWFAVFATLGYFCAPFLLFNLAERSISSGLTAICFATVSVLIVVLSVPILNNRLSGGQIAGVLIAFGALALLVTNAQEVSAKNVWGVVAALTAASMHSFAYVMIKKHGAPVHTLTLNTVPMAVAGLLLTGTSLVIDRPGMDVFTTESVLATVHLGLVGSVIGLVAYFWLLQKLSAVTVSFVFVIFPVIAQLASVSRGEAHFGPVDFMLTAVILGGFALTQLSTRKTTNARTPDAEPPAEEPLDRDLRETADDAPLTEEQLRRIYDHAKRTYPQECCGFVRRSAVRECRNAVAESAASNRTVATGYAFTPADTLELYNSLDSDDPALVVYHSHPDAGAYMSAEDQRFAVLDGMPVLPVAHLVVDVTAQGVRGARLFRFDERGRAYAETAVYGDPHPPGDRPTAGVASRQSAVDVTAGNIDD